jgi:ABC-2 type transport system permease protein
MLAKLTWTEIKLGLREPTVAVFALAFPLILLYLLLNSFGTLPDPDFGGVSPADWYVPAYAVGSIAATGLIAIPVHLAAYRERGVLRRLRASGIAAWPVLAAQTLVAALIVAVGSAVMIALGDASYELSTPGSWAVVVAGLVLATATFCAVGVALASLLPTARAAQVVGLLLFFAMFFISGGGPPEAILPDGVATAANALPMAYAVDVVQGGWWTGSWDVPALVVQAAVLAAATAVALWRLRDA